MGVSTMAECKHGWEHCAVCYQVDLEARLKETDEALRRLEKHVNEKTVSLELYDALAAENAKRSKYVIELEDRLLRLEHRALKAEAERDALREPLERALNYFDTATMCGNDLSDLAEPCRRVLSSPSSAADYTRSIQRAERERCALVVGVVVKENVWALEAVRAIRALGDEP
jgi:hypothetical protein